MDNQQSVFDFIKLVHQLRLDTSRLERGIEENDDELTRRLFVRSLFAEIEGTTFALKQAALDTASHMHSVSPFLPEEVILLAEKSYDLDNEGNVKSQAARIPMSKNIRFAFKAFAKVNRTTYELKVDGIGWQSFKKSIKVRDRLMHPKNTIDLVVTDQELTDAKNTFKWFKQSQDELLVSAIDELKEKMQILGIGES